MGSQYYLEVRIPQNRKKSRKTRWGDVVRRAQLTNLTVGDKAALGACQKKSGSLLPALQGGWLGDGGALGLGGGLEFGVEEGAAPVGGAELGGRNAYGAAQVGTGQVCAGEVGFAEDGAA